MSSKSSHSSSSRRHTRDRKSERSRSPRRSQTGGRHKHDDRSKKDVQRGIDKAKNLLKSSLNEAIDHGKSLESLHKIDPKKEQKDSSDILDSVSRQAAIELIEEPGFRPCSFKSDADSGRSTFSVSKGSENPINLVSSTATQHDRAMFGPLWATKKVLEKTSKKEVNGKKREDNQEEEDEKEEEKDVQLSRFPMAHEKLSEDPEIRNLRWLELFRERRKMAIEGIL